MNYGGSRHDTYSSIPSLTRGLIKGGRVNDRSFAMLTAGHKGGYTRPWEPVNKAADCSTYGSSAGGGRRPWEDNRGRNQQQEDRSCALANHSLPPPPPPPPPRFMQPPVTSSRPPPPPPQLVPPPPPPPPPPVILSRRPQEPNLTGFIGDRDATHRGQLPPAAPMVGNRGPQQFEGQWRGPQFDRKRPRVEHGDINRDSRSFHSRVVDSRNERRPDGIHKQQQWAPIDERRGAYNRGEEWTVGDFHLLEGSSLPNDRANQADASRVINDKREEELPTAAPKKKKIIMMGEVSAVKPMKAERSSAPAPTPTVETRIETNVNDGLKEDKKALTSAVPQKQRRRKSVSGEPSTSKQRISGATKEKERKEKIVVAPVVLEAVEERRASSEAVLSSSEEEMIKPRVDWGSLEAEAKKNALQLLEKRKREREEAERRAHELGTSVPEFIGWSHPSPIKKKRRRKVAPVEGEEVAAADGTEGSYVTADANNEVVTHVGVVETVPKKKVVRRKPMDPSSEVGASSELVDDLPAVERRPIARKKGTAKRRTAAVVLSASDNLEAIPSSPKQQDNPSIESAESFIARAPPATIYTTTHEYTSVANSSQSSHIHSEPIADHEVLNDAVDTSNSNSTVSVDASASVPAPQQRRGKRKIKFVYLSDEEEQPPPTFDWSQLEKQAKMQAKELLAQRRASKGEIEADVPADMLEPACEGWVRRSVRAAGVTVLESNSTKKLLSMIKTNHEDVEVCKLHHWIGPDANTGVLNAVLEALHENTNCQALYMQNFNEGVSDDQIDALLTILRKGNIWCLNLGELYKVSQKCWWRFCEELRQTHVTHLYISEHVISSELKTKLRDVIRANRSKHIRHKDINNLHVIERCTHCWWNPWNAASLQAAMLARGMTPRSQSASHKNIEARTPDGDPNPPQVKAAMNAHACSSTSESHGDGMQNSAIHGAV